LNSSYKIDKDTFHYLWNNKHKPALHIKSGDRVKFEVNEVASWQITKKSKIEDLVKLDEGKLYPLAGPVYVEGASAGDALSISIENIKTADWGWSAIIPGLGLLPEFKEHYLHIWDLSKRKTTANFKRGIKVPLGPFCGVMGVAPKESGEFSVLPPGHHGGNMDIKHLTEGSKLVLPVWNDGALFSVGDLHAAQGDGEVCVTAIECPGTVTLKFNLIKNAKISTPRFFTSPKSQSRTPRFVTTGIASDLMEASREAVRNMIEHLVGHHRLRKEEAYILCSVAADLRIHEVVDAPNWVVGLAMPLGIFS
jgi:acetamidase/formamidase